LQETGEEERAVVGRFLKAMVNPELRTQIDRLPHDGSPDGGQKDG
jgi:hypothetical protein